MTGEVTLRGRVLPIGGLKEKLLAALRGGIKKVLIPEENVKDLADIADNVKNALDITPVARMDDVLKHARAGDRSFLGDVADQEDGDTAGGQTINAFGNPRSLASVSNSRSSFSSLTLTAILRCPSKSHASHQVR